MQKNRDILSGYENMPLIRYDSDEAKALPNVVAYEDRKSVVVGKECY